MAKNLAIGYLSANFTSKENRKSGEFKSHPPAFLLSLEGLLRSDIQTIYQRKKPE